MGGGGWGGEAWGASLIPHGLNMMVSVLCFFVCAALCAVCNVQAKCSHWTNSISCVYCKLSWELRSQHTNGFQPQWSWRASTSSGFTCVCMVEWAYPVISYRSDTQWTQCGYRSLDGLSNIWTIALQNCHVSLATHSNYNILTIMCMSFMALLITVSYETELASCRMLSCSKHLLLS